MTSNTYTRASRLLAQFRDDARGVTAILFAAVAVAVLGLGLAALDYSRTQGTKAAIQTAADAAAVAGAKMLGAPHDEIETAVRGYLRTNLPKERQDLDFVLTFATDDTALTIKMNTAVPTTILGIVGVNEMNIAIASTVERSQPVKDTESPHLGIAPDGADGVSKLDDTKRATPSPDDIRRAEAEVRRMLENLEADGGPPEVQRLLRELKNLR